MIRQAVKSDIPELVKIAALQVVGPLPQVAKDPVKIAAAFELALKNKDCMLLTAVSEAGGHQGYALTHWIPFPLLAGMEAYVSDLMVSPAFRGLGVGSQLLEAVEAEAEKRHCVRVMLNNPKEAESFRRNYYRKRGYQERINFANFVKIMNAPEEVDRAIAVKPQ